MNTKHNRVIMNLRIMVEKDHNMRTGKNVALVSIFNGDKMTKSMTLDEGAGNQFITEIMDRIGEI